MFEGILYFVLGFLSAAMIALMISPAIWARAVALTRKRVENSVPLTLNEIQADKDQLRAEFAMSTRRLEMSVEELREKAANQIIEISRKRDELAKIGEESRERIKVIEELEIHASELRSRLKDREEKLSETSSRLDRTTAKLEEKAKQLEQLRGELTDSRYATDSSRIELVAKQTEMQNLSDQVAAASLREEQVRQEIQGLKETAEASENALRREENRNAELERRLESLQKQLAANGQDLTERERELARLRQENEAEDQARADLDSRLVEAQSRNVELEAKLAQSVLQMESLLNDASNDNVEKAMASLSRDKEELEARLEAITRERDHLKLDLSQQARHNSEDWEVERRENAILRERINDLAAQVTAMTSTIEGEHSAIGKILSVPVEAEAATSSAPGASASQAPEKKGRKSLADRIRALQETSRQNNAV